MKYLKEALSEKAVTIPSVYWTSVLLPLVTATNEVAQGNHSTACTGHRMCRFFANIRDEVRASIQRHEDEKLSSSAACLVALSLLEWEVILPILEQWGMESPINQAILAEIKRCLAEHQAKPATDTAAA